MHRNTMEKTLDSIIIRREILTYLGNFPEKFKAYGTHSIPDLFLALGNCFVWLSPKLHESHPQIQPPGAAPQSIFQLGKLFQEMGREWDETNSVGLTGSILALVVHCKGRIDELEKRLNRTEAGQ